ncbi:cupin-like domain-containing protein [Massilia sp. 9096]|uniref:cupin-like domain-containing protein n=1 Tax=Massilia sp. 9096 TaxID=1500894 RepID=UPI00056A7BC3|nr:cupin-like domain-containing protein [Massilia sp. 9096]
MSQPIREYNHVDAALLHDEILSCGAPALLRGFVSGWPAVAHARASPEAICRYLLDCDSGQAVDALLLPPQERGRLFYAPDMNGFNFARRRLPVSHVIEQLARYSQFADPPSVAVQSAPVGACLPRFGRENRLAAIDIVDAPARIWIGNAIVTPAHFDESENIACVVAGRRRFTLFAPEQVGNLYIGPLDYAPTPTPISMVDFNAPDLARFPRFARAMEGALVAELGPGDAIYIPSLWWHHVQSTGPLNILVNYWWKAVQAVDGERTPMQALAIAMDALRAMPPAQRQAWAAMFGHYVFDAGVDPAAHLPAHRHGVLTKVRPQ